MKRTPLKRTGRIRVRPKKAMSAEEKALAGVFHLATVRRKACVVCGRMNDECRRGVRVVLADGTVIDSVTHLQAHHVLSQQRLRKHGLEHLLWDPRNGAAVCEEPCHRRHSSRRKNIPRWRLPREALEFAEECGLTAELEREYPDE